MRSSHTDRLLGELKNSSSLRAGLKRPEVWEERRCDFNVISEK